MAFTSNDLNNVNDKVTLKLGGEELLIAESYDVRTSWFRQPASFALRTGWGGTVLDLLDKYPENTPFELYIADRLQFTGRIDEIDVEQTDSASEVTFKGRDDLAPLHDAYATADRSFGDDNYDDVLSKLLDTAGITDYTIIFENDSNRDRKTGITVAAAASSSRKVFGKARAKKTQKNAGQLKLGDRLYEFIKKELDRVGLFLFATTSNTFVIAEPSPLQTPAYQILRRRGATRNLVNTTRAHLRKATTRRYSEAIIYGRGGGQKFGQQPVSGSYLDNEMLLLGYPRARAITMRDEKCSSDEQAKFLARKAIADGRREGFVLEYEVSGHSVPAASGRSVRDLAVWCVDTVVHVIDDEFGLDEPFWISDVAFNRDMGGGTRTSLTLVRPGDVLYGSGP